MKKYLLILALGFFVSLALAGCLGQLAEQSEKNERQVAEAKFDTYLKMAVAEQDPSTVTVRNTLPTTVSLKITVGDHQDAWKLFQVPGQNTLKIKLGASDYLFQVQADSDTGRGASNVLEIPPGNVTIDITGTSSDQFNVFIPNAK